MSAFNNGSGPRSNRYSRNRLTNWREYEPWWLEVQSVFKKFDGRIAKHPTFPKVIELKSHPDFVRPCYAQDVEAQLEKIDPEFLLGLRAVFILAGTTKQSKSWGSATSYYGHYWNQCVFLHAFPAKWAHENLDVLHRYYLRHVLVHEIGHHVDTFNQSRAKRELFANKFAKAHG